MNSKELSQTAGTAPSGVMALDSANIGWDVVDFAQHQIQIGNLDPGDTATLHTSSPAPDNDAYVAVQQVLGSDSSDHMIVLNPDSGRHQKLKVVFSNTSGSANVVINSHYSAAHHFAR